MSDERVLPPRMTLLGEAMRPIWLKVRAQLDMPVQQASAVTGMGNVVSQHFDSLQNTIPRLEDRINRLMTDVVSNEEATDGEVYRAVGRFEAFLDDLLADHQAVRALKAYGADVEARDLLAGVYRHFLVEVRDWLGELVETLADPMAAVKKRGLPTSGHVELPLTLTLTAAPQLMGLSRWAERQSVSLSSPQNSTGYRAPRKSGLGFWGTVGVIVLGWGIGEALFGDDDCGCDGDV